MPDDTFLAVVCFGADLGDLGDLYKDASGGLSVRWRDGHTDTVSRDRRGWLWDEYGDTAYRDARGHGQRGTRLPVVSRRRCDAVCTPTPPAATPPTVRRSKRGTRCSATRPSCPGPPLDPR